MSVIVVFLRPLGLRLIDLYTPYLSKYFVPIGEKAQDNRARFKNQEYDDVVTKLQTINPDAPEAQALYDQALDLWMKNLPTGPGPTGMNVYNWNETYWTNWPSAQNPYTHAHIAWDLGTWWLHNLKKVKA